MKHKLDALFQPESIAFIGGSNLRPALRYQRDIGFAGDVWVVNPKYQSLEGYLCVPSIRDLPAAPDLAFVAIRREAAVEAVSESCLLLKEGALSGLTQPRDDDDRHLRQGVADQGSKGSQPIVCHDLTDYTDNMTRCQDQH